MQGSIHSELSLSKWLHTSNPCCSSHTHQHTPAHKTCNYYFRQIKSGQIFPWRQCSLRVWQNRGPPTLTNTHRPLSFVIFHSSSESTYLMKTFFRNCLLKLIKWHQQSCQVVRIIVSPSLALLLHLVERGRTLEKTNDLIPMWIWFSTWMDAAEMELCCLLFLFTPHLVIPPALPPAEQSCCDRWG